jgi:hypothetical protein
MSRTSNGYCVRQGGGLSGRRSPIAAAGNGLCRPHRGGRGSNSERATGVTSMIEHANSLPGATPPFHPEFGYLCPSPAVCRKVRLALTSGAAGVLIGAICTLSLLDKRLTENSPADHAVGLVRMDRQEEVDRFPPLDVPNVPLGKDAALLSLQDCSESARSFFDRTCRFLRKRKLRGARPTARLAGEGIGRSDPAEATVQQQPRANDGGSMRASIGQGDAPVVSSAQIPVSAEKTKIAHARKRLLAPTADGVNAFAHALTDAEPHRYQSTPRR